MARKRQVQEKREKAAKLEENAEQIVETEVDYSNRSTIDQIMAKVDKNCENMLRRKFVAASKGTEYLLQLESNHWRYCRRNYYHKRSVKKYRNGKISEEGEQVARLANYIKQ